MKRIRKAFEAKTIYKALEHSYKAGAYPFPLWYLGSEAEKAPMVRFTEKDWKPSWEETFETFEYMWNRENKNCPLVGIEPVRIQASALDIDGDIGMKSMEKAGVDFMNWPHLIDSGRSNGGFHIYCKATPEIHKCMMNSILPGVDFRCRRSVMRIWSGKNGDTGGNRMKVVRWEDEMPFLPFPPQIRLPKDEPYRGPIHAHKGHGIDPQPGADRDIWLPIPKSKEEGERHTQLYEDAVFARTKYGWPEARIRNMLKLKRDEGRLNRPDSYIERIVTKVCKMPPTLDPQYRNKQIPRYRKGK